MRASATLQPLKQEARMGAGHSNGGHEAVYASGGKSVPLSAATFAPDLAWRTMADETFLADCTFEAFRASGPGGQKRNKTSSAVRLTHEPSGVSAVANESRSQHDNRKTALRRLRHKVVLECRQAVDVKALVPPEWKKPPSPKGEGYLPVMGLVLDVLAATQWSVSDAARVLGITTGALVRFLQADRKLMAHVNERRSAGGLKPLGVD
jgi:hypothetical protein